MKIDETYRVQSLDEHGNLSEIEDFTERSVELHFHGKVCKSVIVENISNIDEQWMI
jgi:hypothetical protein